MIRDDCSIVLHADTSVSPAPATSQREGCRARRRCAAIQSPQQVGRCSGVGGEAVIECKSRRHGLPALRARRRRVLASHDVIHRDTHETSNQEGYTISVRAMFDGTSALKIDGGRSAGSARPCSHRSIPAPLAARCGPRARSRCGDGELDLALRSALGQANRLSTDHHGPSSSRTRRRLVAVSPSEGVIRAGHAQKVQMLTQVHRRP